MRSRSRISDLYSVSPWVDWLGAAVVAFAAWVFGAGSVTDFATLAIAVSTVSGIFAAVAVFACGAAFQSQTLVLRVARAALPTAMRRSWVSIVFGLLTAAAIPVVGLYVAESSQRAAELLVLAAGLLNLLVVVRVGWWVDFIARAQQTDDHPPFRAQRPEWMHEDHND